MKRLLPILFLLLVLTGCSSKPDMLDNKTPADTLGALYYTGIPLPDDGSEPDLYDLDGDLLMMQVKYYDVGQCELKLYRMDTDSGELTHSLILPAQGYATIQVHGDTVCLCSPASGKVWMLSHELELRQEYTLESSYYDWYVSPDLTKLYQLGWDTGLLQFDLASGSSTVLLSETLSPSYRAHGNDWLTISYVSPETQMTCNGRLSFATGQIEPFPYDQNFGVLEWQDNFWLGSLTSTDDAYLMGRDGTALSVVNSTDTFLSLNSHGQIVCRNYMDGTVGLYDSNGQFLSAVQLPTGENGPHGYLSTSMVWSEERNGWFLFMTTITEPAEPGQEPQQTTELMFWDLSVPVTGEALPLLSPDTLKPADGNAVAQELYDRADAIGKKYGVTIKIADLCETEFDDFTTTIVTDPLQIALGLDELEAALSRYPIGFFTQLRYGTIREIEISLTGGLTPVIPENYDGGVNAFAQPLYDKYIIVADLYQTWEQSYHHEFSHLIDKRLQWDADHREGAIFSEDSWATLNPSGFDYDWSYAVYNSRPTDVPYDYFISSYAMTYPTEDRATLWENAMVGYDWQFYTPQLKEKLLYYSRCIRDCFDTTDWPSTTTWEAVLG